MNAEEVEVVIEIPKGLSGWREPERTDAPPGALPAAGLVLAVLVASLTAVIVRHASGPEAGYGLVSGPSTTTTVAVSTAPVPSRIDHTALSAWLRTAGLGPGPGSSVFAARLTRSGPSATTTYYDAGGGALAEDFWPASSIKVLAAAGALEYLGEQGFTGSARITIGAATFTVADVYDDAIIDSSNAAYDQLVRIAGVDYLNDQLLSPGRGFPRTVIQRSYTAGGVLRVSPAMTIAEGQRTVAVPARTGDATYGCEGSGNCSNLLEMTESVRRIVLHEQLPAAERFRLAGADVARLRAALLAAEGFVEPAVLSVLGNDDQVYNKPGWVPRAACVDVAIVGAVGTPQYLLAVATPVDGVLCPSLVALARSTLEFLRARERPPG